MIAYAAARDLEHGGDGARGAAVERATVRPHNLRRRVVLLGGLVRARRVNEQRRDSMSTHHTNSLLVHAIGPARLDVVRTTGADGHGNQLRPFAATGEGEPLRCCLRYAEPGEQITLISYAPFEHPSVWREVGPVYIHAARCEGYTPDRPAARTAGHRPARPAHLSRRRHDELRTQHRRHRRGRSPADHRASAQQTRRHDGTRAHLGAAVLPVRRRR